MSRGDPRRPWNASETESEPLRLHENENPYGCSLLVQESLSAHDTFSRKPSGLPITLMKALSRYTGRSQSNIYLAESPEDLLFRILSVTGCHRGQLIACTPYGDTLRNVLRATGLRAEESPWEPGKKLPTDELIRKYASSGMNRSVIYIGTPNDPTGDVIAPLDAVTLLHAGFTVIADEIYAEFTDRAPGVIGGEFPNFVSLRSFAPWAGLWGIPVSYGLLPDDLHGELERQWPQHRLSDAARIAAGASLDDQTLLLNRVRHIRLERARLFRRLRKLNFLQPLPSQGPFILCEITRGTADSVCGLLTRDGIQVRNCTEYGLPKHIRISVGTPADTDHLFSAMRRISISL